MKSYWILSSVIILVACGDDNVGELVSDLPPASVITDLSTESRGENCEFGGVSVSTGVDDNGNGTLELGEVDSVGYLCSDETPAERQVLTDLATVGLGDECEFGGVSLSTGLDGNSNGILDASEIGSVDYLCNDEPAAPAQLVSDLATEPPGDNCEFGGVSLTVGIDDDQNGVLDLEEVDSLDFLCNDEPIAPLQLLTDLVVEAPGGNCEFGGVALNSGLDDDRDGSLSQLEVDAVDYLCDDEPEAPSPLLTDLTREPAGENCEFGGVSLSTGLDDNDNGVLELAERDGIDFLCDEAPEVPNRIIPSSVTISSFLELDLLSSYTEIQGDLNIDGTTMGGLERLELPNLERVTGIIHLSYFADVDSVSLPSLIGARSFRMSHFASILSVEAPALQELDFYSFNTLSSVQEISLAGVEEVRSVRLVNLPALRSVDLGTVNEVDEFYIQGASALESVGFKEGSTIGNFTLEGAESINTVFSGGFTVTGNMDVSGFINDAGVDIHAASVGGALRVQNLQGASSLNFPALESIAGELLIRSNSTTGALSFPSLTTLNQATVIASGIGGVMDFSALTTISDTVNIIGGNVGTIDFSSIVTLSSSSSTPLRIQGASVGHVDLSSLRSMEKSIEMSRGTLASVDLSSLKSVSPGSNLRVFQLSGLASLSLPQLTSGGNLYIERNPQLASLSLPSLNDVGDYVVRFNDVLPCEDVEAPLGGLSYSNLSIVQNGGANCVEP